MASGHRTLQSWTKTLYLSPGPGAEDSRAGRGPSQPGPPSHRVEKPPRFLAQALGAPPLGAAHLPTLTGKPTGQPQDGRSQRTGNGIKASLPTCARVKRSRLFCLRFHPFVYLFPRKVRRGAWRTRGTRLRAHI